MYHDQLDGTGVLSHSDVDSALAPSVFESDGGKYGWEDLRVDGQTVRLPAASAPVWTSTGTLGAYAFTPSGGEYAYFSAQLPHGYIGHTAYQSPSDAPYWHTHFRNSATIGTGNTVTFRLSYSVGPVNGAMSNLLTADSTYTASATLAAGYSLMTSDVLLNGTYNYKASTILLCRIERLSSDTFADDALLLSTDFHLKMNRLGSSLRSGVR